MKALDPKSFLADSLRPYAVDGKAGLPSLFERYGLEPADDDEAAIAARLREVKGIWSKSYENPRYGTLAKKLVSEHDDAELALLDHGERARLAAAMLEDIEATKAEEERALQEWRGIVREHAARGGLTPHSRAHLERIAAQRGLSTDLVKRELDAVPEAAPPTVLSPDVRKLIRTTLQTLAREEGEDRLGLSLYHALGLEGITENVAKVRAAHDRLTAEIAQRGYGRSQTNYKAMLAQVSTHLLDKDKDPRAYLQGMKHDLSEVMAFEAAQATADGVIDVAEAESLKRSALARGLTPALADELIADLARESGASIVTGERVDYVSCPRCNSPHPRPDGATKCKRCSTPLFMSCPRDGCGTTNDATSLRCSACDADLQQYATARRRLEALPDALRDGRIAWAVDEVAEITKVLGAGALSEELRTAVDRAHQQAQAQWAGVETALAASRLYAARAGLRTLKDSAHDMLGPGTGESPADRLKVVDSRLAEVDAALTRARSSTAAQREAALVEALGLAADCAEAERALAAIPPLPPGRVTAGVQTTGVAIRWEGSRTGGAQYAIRRVDEASGATQEVGTTTATHHEDTSAPNGAALRYDITTVRGSARSESVRSNPVLVAREVRGLSVSDLDGEVRLTWSAVPPTGRVLVRRRAEGSGRTTELVGDRTGLVDADVTNGERYAYDVSVEYTAAGIAPERTPGQTVYGQPAAPPTGIDDLAVTDVPGGVLVTFTRPPSGTVTVVRCDDAPPVVAGETLNPGVLSTLGRELPMSADGARDGISTGVCWYLPVTVAGGMSVAGRAIRHLALAPLTGVRAEQGGNEVRVTWEWPEGIRLARVLWRLDAQPMGPDQPGVESVWVRKGQYLDDGGFAIESERGRSVFVAVVSALFVDGERISGAIIAKSARAAVRNVERAGLSYSVRRAGMRKKRLEVEVSAPEGRPAPALVLVARDGDLLPRTAKEGEEIARFGGDQPLTATVDISGRGRPLTVRMFLSAGSAAEAFQLTDPAIDDLVVR